MATIRCEYCDKEYKEEDKMILMCSKGCIVCDDCVIKLDDGRIGCPMCIREAEPLEDVSTWNDVVEGMS